MLRSGRFVLLAAALGAWGCALVPVTPDLHDSHEAVIGGEKFVFQYEEVDRDSAAQVVAAIEQAVPRIAKWGRFTTPITIRIHPSHEALEEAVHRIDYPWLRAWSRYDSIDLQSPRTWGFLGAVQGQLVELLTHELTHCLMYQRSGSATTWMFKGIPLWFREGMASVTAHQGYRRPTDEEIWRYLREHPGEDPVADADALYQSQSDIVYGAAHRAFRFLVDRYGDGVVRDLMARMKAGSGFDAAFRAAVGLPVQAFTSDFHDYIRWEGWRSRASAPLVPPGGSR